MSDLPSLHEAGVAAQRRYDASACDCAAKLLDVRQRTFDNGSKHFVQQCTRCGEQRGNPLGRAAASSRLAGRTPLAFDTDLEETFRAHRMALLKQVTALHGQELAVRSPALVAELAAMKAKGERLASLVAQCADQLLLETSPELAADALARKAVTLRSELRDAARRSTPRFMSEDELKAWLVATLGEDFELFPEVPGRHVATGTRVKIDYVAFPKRHLIDHGFASVHFGIEVKQLDPFDGFSQKAARALWQTVSYTDSEFFPQGRPNRLKFALLFSNMSFDAERKLLNRTGETFENDGALWAGLLQLANHANVGTLEIRGNRNAPSGWKIAFSGGTYFGRRANEEPQYRRSDEHTIEKNRIGSF
jgi:hypothetical protein